MRFPSIYETQSFIVALKVKDAYHSNKSQLKNTEPGVALSSLIKP